MGLLQPHGRHRGRDGEADLVKDWLSPPRKAGVQRACRGGPARPGAAGSMPASPGMTERTEPECFAAARRFGRSHDQAVPHPRRRRCRRKTRPPARRPQRADRKRPRDRCDAHRARRADHHGDRRTKAARSFFMAHFGRPKGGPDEANSLKPVAAAVADVIKRPVAFCADCIGRDSRRRNRQNEQRRRAAAGKHPLP